MIEALPVLLMTYGPAMIFAITFLAAFGLPAPAMLTLIAAGALSSFDVIDYRWVLVSGFSGTVAGDHGAYLLGRILGDRISGWRIARRLKRAERILTRWGIFGVFFSRWLLQSVLAPTVNYFSGLARLPWRRFTPAIVAGEAIFVSSYSALGRTFSTQIAQLNAVAATASLLLLSIMLGVGCLIFIIIRLKKPSP